MGSFNWKGRNQGRDPRRGAKGRRVGFVKIECLEGRVVLSPTPRLPTTGPVSKPVRHSFQVIATNEAVQAFKADVAQQQFGVNGAGVTVGVLSNSVNLAANPGGRPRGLAGSYQTGDLAPNSVRVLSDGIPG